MNYRHAFHAGNFADVVKHAILARLIVYLQLKPAPFRVIDTHAGIGRYDLTGEEATRSPEWRDGIGKVLDASLPPEVGALLAPYLDVVRAENPAGALAAYPGSPLIARRLFRPQDRLTALELHPQDAETLRALFSGDVQARVTALDGWLALGAYLPPKERRAIVLVDPPFEEAGEFGRLAAGLKEAHRKFATGIYALWYPLKDEAALAGFAAALAGSGIAKMLRAELVVRRPATPPRLFGSGMIIVNPPFTLEAELDALLPALAGILGEDGGAGYRLDWLTGRPA